MDSVKYYKSHMADPNDYDKLVVYSNIKDLFDDTTSKFKDSIAVRWLDGEVTYSKFRSDVAKLRYILKNNGVKKGDHVGLLFKNEYDFVKSFFAITTLGAVAACIPMTLPSQAIFGLTKLFGLSTIIHNSSLDEKMAEVLKMNPNLVTLNQETINTESPESEGNKIDKDDPACIVFTGGTTGAPKGALLSHRNMCRGAFNGCLVPGKVFGIKYVSLIPFTHVFGLVKNLLSNFVSGSSLYMVAEPTAFVREMAKAAPETMVLTPALARLVFNLIKGYGKILFGPDFSNIIAGGAAVPANLVLDLKSVGIDCYPGYGLTETANLVSGNAENIEYPDSVGVVYPEQEVKIVDGEILVKGDNIFLGYYNNPEATNTVLKDGWLYTGDLGKFDEEGRLYILGRKGNLIVLESGLKFSPEEVEAEINKNPLVFDSVVYLDSQTNQIVAEVFLNGVGNPKVDIAANEKIVTDFIINTVNKNIVSHAAIHHVVYRKEDFKRSPAMKILREKH